MAPWGSLVTSTRGGKSGAHASCPGGRHRAAFPHNGSRLTPGASALSPKTRAGVWGHKCIKSLSHCRKPRALPVGSSGRRRQPPDLLSRLLSLLAEQPLHGNGWHEFQEVRRSNSTGVSRQPCSRCVATQGGHEPR